MKPSLYVLALIGGITWAFLNQPLHADQADGVSPPEAPKLSKLVVGDPAPEFKVERFIKGEPFIRFENGKIYLIEFWATSCGPCVQSIPYLSQLQKNYRDKNVIVCGVDVWEDTEITDATLTKVAAYVAKRGESMAYTVAYDGAAGNMDKNWLKATGAPGIPWAIIIDRKGRIAWIGHSMRSGFVLDEMIANTWDIQNGPKQIEAAENTFKDAAKKYNENIAAGDAAWENATARYPVMAPLETVEHFAAMLQANDDVPAFALGSNIVEAGKRSTNPTDMQNLMVVLSHRTQRSAPEYKTLFMNAAKATFALSDPAEAGPHIIMAEAYFATGDTDNGHAEAAAAIERASPSVKDATSQWLKEIEQRYAH